MSKVLYLESLLKPDATPPVSIPDDNIRRHTLRQETITANITSPASGNGIIVLYPNTPSSLIGTSYFETSPGVYVFDQSITVAQELAESYDYARKSSQIVYIRSATLPAGVYALTGTFNAVTYEGPLSEIGLPPYNSILQSTANPMDKVGNVLVGTGIAALMLPASYDLAYTRMNDPAVNSGLGTGRIRDSQSDLLTTYNVVTGTLISTASAGGTIVTIGSVNVDGNIGVTVVAQIRAALTFASATTAPRIGYIEIDYLSITGAVLDTFLGTEFNIPTGTTTITGSSTLNITYPDGSIQLTQSIAAVRFYFRCTSPLIFTINFTGFTDLAATLRSLSGGTPGIQYPVTLIRYSGVSQGSIISVSGVSNYELIPNPELARNIVTYYGDRDPRGMEYVKAVMANRDALGIRTVWPIQEYRQRMSLFSEMASMRPDNGVTTEAMAFGIKDFLNTLRIGLPFADWILPRAVVKTAEGLLDIADDVFAASGAPVAASGRPVAAMRKLVPGRKMLNTPRRIIMD